MKPIARSKKRQHMLAAASGDIASPLATFFNSAERAMMLVAFDNEIAIGEDGWAQIAPFGDFPGIAYVSDGQGGFKRERAIQRMDRTAVQNMVAEFNHSRRGARKFLRGCPIYHGHPDMPDGKEKYEDAEPKGVFANLEVREPRPGGTPGGFYGEPILTEAGEKLVATRRVRAFSGRWEAGEYLGEETIAGMTMKVFRRTKFLSAGLTDRPNLPVEMFNEAQAGSGRDNNQQKETEMKKEVIIALLAGLGVTLANDATDEQVQTAIKDLGAKAARVPALETEKTTLANEKRTLANEKASLEGKVTTLTGEKTALTTERDAARTQFTNERMARIGDLLDGAIKTGRITAAERSQWETRLNNDAQFVNEAEALSKLSGMVKTTSITLQRGDRKVEISNASERREILAELVNDRIAEAKCDYDAAYAWAQKNHPALFAAMESPEVRKGGPKKT